MPSTHIRFAPARVLLALAIVLAAACDSSVTDPDPSPLSGLVRAFAEDSAGTPVEPPEGTPGSGYFAGIVRGPNTPGTSGDTLGTSPRISNVVIRAYPIIGGTGGSLELGPEVGSTTSDVDGAFTFPMISGGDYAVTFTPPAASGYTGTWVLARVDAQTHTFPWWVTLPKE